MKTKEDLNKLYTESSEAYKPDFAKMRSSLLLIAGDHYSKRGIGKFFDRVRTTRDFSNETKIRLTRNHIGRIVRRIANIILSAAPGVGIKPKHEREMQDRKSAELNHAVWIDGKERNEWDDLTMRWVDDFVGIGEVFTKIYYDPNDGPIIAYEPAMNELGQPTQLPDGTLAPDMTKPIFEGALKFEENYGFNVLIDVNAKDVRKSPHYCLRKMVATKDLKKDFPNLADDIDDSEDDTFMIFEVGAGYRQSKKGETLLKEWFWRPCAEYPKGYFAIQAKDSDPLVQGELPSDQSGAIFPIECERYDYVQTKPRGIASTEPLRPYQMNINSMASKAAEHRVTLGDDKLVLVNGSKLSAGATLPGIRSMTVTGQAPTVIEGRVGNQYAEPMNAEITEMYQIADLDDEDTDNANLDPQVLLYRSAKQKKKFSRYIGRFENYLVRVCRLYLRSAKYYFSDQAAIMAIGKNEQVNIKEFKNTTDTSLQFTVEPQAEDIETKLGRQLSINHILQYVGTQLGEDSIGKLIAEMPYSNLKEAFSDLTLDHECATNDMLALDRGDMPYINPDDPHPYMVKRATARRREADYRYLPPFIQENYQKYIDGHLKIMDEQKQALQRSESGFIPDGGALVGIDLYVQDPNNPERTRRARIPQSSGEWLLKKLQEQGAFKEEVSAAPEEALGQYAKDTESAPQGLNLADLDSAIKAQGPNAEIEKPTF